MLGNGYIGYSKSVNAARDEEDGRYPLSRAVPIIANRAGVPRGVALRWATKIGPVSWHHTSKFYNVVNYYDVGEIADNIVFSLFSAVSESIEDSALAIGRFLSIDAIRERDRARIARERTEFAVAAERERIADEAELERLRPARILAAHVATARTAIREAVQSNNPDVRRQRRRDLEQFLGFPRYALSGEWQSWDTHILAAIADGKIMTGIKP